MRNLVFLLALFGLPAVLLDSACTKVPPLVRDKRSEAALPFYQAASTRIIVVGKILSAADVGAPDPSKWYPDDTNPTSPGESQGRKRFARRCHREHCCLLLCKRGAYRRPSATGNVQSGRQVAYRRSGNVFPPLGLRRASNNL
jgi:hypothetical protein